MFKVLRVAKTNRYDVFRGEGWYGWTRVGYGHSRNDVSHIAGELLNEAEKSIVWQEIDAKRNHNKVVTTEN